MPLCPFSNKASTSGVCPATGRKAAETQALPKVTPSKRSASEHSIVTDLSKVRADLKHALRSPGHDDGSLAPLFIRFSWHCCGTYDKAKNNGGSNGATMRFAAEQSDPENAGLAKAIEVLNKVHARHPYMSLADIYVLAGYVAFEATGGPVIPFSVGRKDFTEQEAEQKYGRSLCPFGDGAQNPNGSRLPAADLGTDASCPKSSPPHVKEKPTIDAVRSTFERMGLNDKETVALIIMGHQYGRMHPEVSGFEETWYAFDPNHWNVYGPGGLGYITAYVMRATRGAGRERLNSQGKRQWDMNLGGGIFAMIAVDMVLLWDEKYKKITMQYDRNRLDFFRDSALAWKKLTELGCSDLVSETTPGHDRIRTEHMR